MHKVDIEVSYKQFGHTPRSRPNRSQRVVSLLLSAARYELGTHSVYSYLRNVTRGPGSPSLSELYGQASAEDWTHYSDLVDRAKHLSDENVRYDPDTGFASTPTSNSRSALHLLQRLQATERYLVNAYREICRLTIEYDYSTFDLSFRNLTENQGHDQHLTALIPQGLQNAGFTAAAQSPFYLLAMEQER